MWKSDGAGNVTADTCRLAEPKTPLGAVAVIVVSPTANPSAMPEGLTEATDGLLLDLHLPDGSGLDLLRDLRQQGGTAQLPVLVITAEGEERILREARRLGATLVTKPFSPTKLTHRIAVMFGDAEEQRGEPQ